MAAKAVKLSGFKAVLVLLVLGGVAAFRFVNSRSTLDTQGRAALQMWVQDELVRPIVADTSRSLVEQGAALAKATSVKIKSLSVHGGLSNAVVRVELAPSPALPPGGDLVRYYRARYTTISGWTHRGNATVLDYYLAAF